MENKEFMFGEVKVLVSWRVWRDVFNRDCKMIEEELESWKEKSNSKEFYVLNGVNEFVVLDENFEEVMLDY